MFHLFCLLFWRKTLVQFVLRLCGWVMMPAIWYSSFLSITHSQDQHCNGKVRLIWVSFFYLFNKAGFCAGKQATVPFHNFTIGLILGQVWSFDNIYCLDRTVSSTVHSLLSSYRPNSCYWIITQGKLISHAEKRS